MRPRRGIAILSYELAGLRPCTTWVGWIHRRVKGVELTVEGSGKVAWGSSDFAVAAAFLGAFGDVLPRSGMVNHPGHGDGVQGTIEAPITAPVEPVTDSVTA